MIQPYQTQYFILTQAVIITPDSSSITTAKTHILTKDDASETIKHMALFTFLSVFQTIYSFTEEKFCLYTFVNRLMLHLIFLFKILVRQIYLV